MAEPSPPSPLQTLSLALSATGVGTLLLAGLVGGLTMQFLGGPLAMALAIWSGLTTEPANPGGSYPWLLFLALGGGAALALVTARGRQDAWARVGPALAVGVAAVASVLPLVWLWILRGRT